MSEGRKGLDARASLRRLGWLLGAGALIVLPLAARVAWEGSAELERAAAAGEAAQRDEQIIHLGRAARWRLPIASHDEQALEQLMALGRDYEEQGSRDDALAAYREARRAILATRAWWLSDRDQFEAANARIAFLMAEQERELGTDLSGSGEQEAYHLALLEQVPGPDPTRSGLTALAFLAWVAATVGFVMRALDAQGRLRAPAAVRWGGASLLLLVLWMVLLRAL